MYEITILNKLTNQEFVKVFYREDFYKKFVNKCKYSKKIRILKERKW